MGGYKSRVRTKSKKNLELIEKYLDHRMLGKPILNKKRKPIKPITEYKIRTWLYYISNWMDKDFDKITENDIDDFRRKLRDNKFRSTKNKPFECYANDALQF